MDYLKLIETMTPEIYQSLKRSVEMGKWPDGRPLTPAPARAMPCRRVIAWGELHLPESERIGFIDKGHKAGDSCDEPGRNPAELEGTGDSRAVAELLASGAVRKMKTRTGRPGAVHHGCWRA